MDSSLSLTLGIRETKVVVRSVFTYKMSKVDLVAVLLSIRSRAGEGSLRSISS